MLHQLTPVLCLGLFPGYSLHQLKSKSFDISKFNLSTQFILFATVRMTSKTSSMITQNS